MIRKRSGANAPLACPAESSVEHQWSCFDCAGGHLQHEAVQLRHDEPRVQVCPTLHVSERLPVQYSSNVTLVVGLWHTLSPQTATLLPLQSSGGVAIIPCIYSFIPRGCRGHSSPLIQHASSQVHVPAAQAGTAQRRRFGSGRARHRGGQHDWRPALQPSDIPGEPNAPQLHILSGGANAHLPAHVPPQRTSAL